MAGDWIKMRADLQTHPKVVRILSAMRTDRLHVVGALHAVWTLFDQHSEDGVLDGYSCDSLDSIIGMPGFSQALCGVGWLETTGDSLKMPEFSTHNGKSAKRRASENHRKFVSRNAAQNDRKMSASNADGLRTREEKILKPPIPPKGGNAVSFKTFIETCKANNEKAISDYKPVWEYAKTAGIPDDWVTLAWRKFARKHERAAKRYKDWRRAFLNCVEDNWYGLWRCEPDGKCVMTGKGFEEQKVNGGEA